MNKISVCHVQLAELFDPSLPVVLMYAENNMGRGYSESEEKGGCLPSGSN